MNDMNMASVLRNVICQLRVASGAWSIRLYNDRSNGGSALSASQKELIAKQIASRIVYAVKGDELYGIARGYAKKSLINLLISRSISNRHLLIARSLLYNSSDMVSVEWTEDDLDLDKYCKRMRTYQTRYSDYLLLCAIDRDSQSPDTASQVFHLLSAFEREDGLSSVYRLGYESDQMISEGYGFMPDIREFYRRISHQARLIVK